VGHSQKEFLHVPGSGRTTLGTEPAMKANILILGHDSACLEVAADIEVLGKVRGWCLQSGAKVCFFTLFRESDAVHRANIGARIALNAERASEDGLHIAVQATLCLREREGWTESKLYLGPDILQSEGVVAQWHRIAFMNGNVIVVAPLVNAHFLARQLDGRCWTDGDIFTVAKQVD